MPSDRKYAFLAILTISICVLAIYIHRHRAGRTGNIDNVLIVTTGHMQRHFVYLIRGVREVVQGYLFLVNTRKRNDSLEKENAELKAKLGSLKEVEFENSRLKELFVFRSEIPQAMIAARVIAHDVSSDYFAIRVDRGKEDGVQIGQGVVSPSGVVGRVLRVSSLYSDVLTLLDPTSSIDVVLQKNRARGILTGESKHLTCKLKYIDRLEDVTVNDRVVSSGFGSIFPKGLLVGYVTAVIPNPTGVLQTVTIKTAVDIYRLEEVFIVSASTIQNPAAE